MQMYCWVMQLQPNKKKQIETKQKAMTNSMCMLEMAGKQKLHETKTDKGQQVPQQDNSFMAYSYTHTRHMKPKLKWCLISVKQKWRTALFLAPPH